MARWSSLGGDSLRAHGSGSDRVCSSDLRGSSASRWRSRVRLVQRPAVYRTVLAAYATLQGAGDAVSRVIRSGLLPGAMEIMDRLAIAGRRGGRAGALSRLTPPPC